MGLVRPPTMLVKMYRPKSVITPTWEGWDGGDARRTGLHRSIERDQQSQGLTDTPIFDEPGRFGGDVHRFGVNGVVHK